MTDSDRFPRELLERYEMGACLASGGYGAVYRATHRELARPVAVKLLHEVIESDPIEVRRFVTEARVAAQLDHPHVLRLLDHGLGDDPAVPRPWIVYELAEGPSVANRLREGPMPVATALTVARQVAAALAAAHALGIVHRDVKPENILEREPGRFALIDFGIALWNDPSRVRTATGMILATPAYVAPDLVRGESASPATDIYALGVTLFECVTGQLPFPSDNLAQLFAAHLDAPVPRLETLVTGLPEGLEPLIQQALAKEAADRFASATEMEQAIAALLRGRPSGKTGTLARTAAAKQTGAHSPTAAVDRSAVPGRSLAANRTASITHRPTVPSMALPPAVALGFPARLAAAAAMLGITVLAAAMMWRPAGVAPAPPSPIAPSPASSSARPEPEESRTALWTRAREEAARLHQTGHHDLELVKFRESLKFMEEVLELPPEPGRTAAGDLVEWARLRLAALECHQGVSMHRIRLAEAMLNSDAEKKHGLELIAAGAQDPALAHQIDHLAMQLDVPDGDRQSVTDWVQVLESAGPGPMLTADFHLLPADQWRAIRDSFDAPRTDGGKGVDRRVKQVLALHTLRLLPPDRWHEEGIKQVVDLMEPAMDCLAGRGRDLDDLVKPEVLNPGARLQLASELRGMSALVSHARAIVRAVVDDRLPVTAQLRYVRAVSVLLSHIRKVMPHRAPQLDAAVIEACADPRRSWLVSTFRSRRHHVTGDHKTEYTLLGESMLAYEKTYFRTTPVAQSSKDTLKTWLRLRSNLTRSCSNGSSHPELAAIAQDFLKRSVIPPAEFKRMQTSTPGVAEVVEKFAHERTDD